jgi:hypothetical protein
VRGADERDDLVEGGRVAVGRVDPQDRHGEVERQVWLLISPAEVWLSRSRPESAA